MHTKFGVGQRVFLADHRTQTVTRHIVLSIVIRCGTEGVGGQYRTIHADQCTIGYVLSDGSEVGEESLHGTADAAFAAMPG